jgi:hypothetical protein
MTEEEAVKALIALVRQYVRENTAWGQKLPEGITIEMHPSTLNFIRRNWVPENTTFINPPDKQETPFPQEIPMVISSNMDPYTWRLAVIKVDVIDAGRLP